MDEFFGASLVAWLVGLGVLVLLGIIIWSIRQHRDPVLLIEYDSPIDQLSPSLAGLTLGTAVAGNSVEVLENGAFFAVLLERIRAAEHSVHLETFLWKEGVLGQRVADALSERARAGKQVRVMLDANGSKNVGKEAVRQMREAGCTVWFFHKRLFRNLGVLNDRDHRKMVIIDGREAFVGGHCIVD
jgi:cardiolipin synthase A/B